MKCAQTGRVRNNVGVCLGQTQGGERLVLPVATAGLERCGIKASHGVGGLLAFAKCGAGFQSRADKMMVGLPRGPCNSVRLKAKFSNLIV